MIIRKAGFVAMIFTMVVVTILSVRGFLEYSFPHTEYRVVQKYHTQEQPEGDTGRVLSATWSVIVRNGSEQDIIPCSKEKWDAIDVENPIEVVVVPLERGKLVKRISGDESFMPRVHRN